MNRNQVQKVAESLMQYPAVSVELATKLSKQYYGRYAQRRGSMVVDVVSSAWRNYDRVEKRIKWHAEMRALEEFVIPRIIREAGFAVYAGGETNPNGTWKRKSSPRKKRKTISKPS